MEGLKTSSTFSSASSSSPVDIPPPEPTDEASPSQPPPPLQPTAPSTPTASTRKLSLAKWALMVTSFFMADVHAGIGPFLGVFLQDHSWSPGPIGSVMTTGGVAALLVGAPVGALIDATHHKRSLAAAGTLVTMAALVATLLGPEIPPLVFVAQAVAAVAASVLMPVVVAMTLGVAGQDGFALLNGRNQAVNHAGNMAAAGFSALLGQRYGLPAVFYLSWGFGVGALVSTVSVPRNAVDHQAARGLKNTGEGRVEKSARSRREAQLGAWKELLRRRELVVLAAALLAFHLGNAAILPLYGQAVVAERKAEPASFTGLTVVVAQGTMVVMSLGASYAVVRGWCGYWPVLLASFCALPVRAAVAGLFVEAWGVWPVQVLDGVGAGLQSVAVPGYVARVLADTGRVNVGLGAVMTAQGVGSSLSPLLGGWITERRGYRTALWVLGVFPLVSLVLWLYLGWVSAVLGRWPSWGLRALGKRRKSDGDAEEGVIDEGR